MRNTPIGLLIYNFNDKKIFIIIFKFKIQSLYNEHILFKECYVQTMQYSDISAQNVEYTNKFLVKLIMFDVIIHVQRTSPQTIKIFSKKSEL